jgi:hypothetical protein
MNYTSTCSDDSGSEQFEAFCEHLGNCDLDAERDQLIRATLEWFPTLIYEEISDFILATGG